MNNFYLVPNTQKKDSAAIISRIVEWIKERDLTVYLEDNEFTRHHFDDHIIGEKEAVKMADCIIVLGGDGTILHTSRRLCHYGIPLLGVNIGNLGFLAEVEAGDFSDAFEKLLEGSYTIENRMMLKTYVDDKAIGLALNDVVLARSGISRMVGYTLSVGDDLVGHENADGVIVATPTGSTAYNLSAGGPIIAPDNDIMVVTPICPHSLTTRSLIINGQDHVKISLERNRDDWTDDLVITLDGQESFQIDSHSIIRIERDRTYAKLIKILGNDFYSVLRMKLAKKKVHGA